MKLLKIFLVPILAIWLLTIIFSSKCYGQSKYTTPMQSFYDSLLYYGVLHPKTSLAIAMMETGYINPEKPPKNYNYFGFRTRNYLKFNSKAESLMYLRRWQEKYYLPWLKNNKGKSYYSFLRHIHYCGNMKHFIRRVKKYELWLSENLELQRNIGCVDTTRLINVN